MLTLDKLKIVVPYADCIGEIDKTKFNTLSKDGVVTAYKYQQVSPYLLYIEQDLEDDELIIEFTGKILGPRYSELINKMNIRQCIENINALKLCTLDIDSILNDAKVVKADVTQDAEYPDISKLTRELQTCIRNNERYTAINKRGNFIVEKNVKTKNRKVRLTIYDKAKEMALQENQQWMCSMSAADRQCLCDYFKDKIRFELNLNSIKAIKDLLGIKDTLLSSVLNAEATPIIAFLDKILVDNSTKRVANSLQDAARLALLKENSYDMKAIENLARSYMSPKTKLSHALQPYRELCEAYNGTGGVGIKEQLKEILLEIFLVGFVNIL